MTGDVPPPLAERLVRGFIADPDLLEAVLGDLAEEWSERVARQGIDAADAWYRRQALASVPHLLVLRWRSAGPRELWRAVLGAARTLGFAVLRAPDPARSSRIGRSTLEAVTTMKNENTPFRRRAGRVVLVTALLLTAPLVAMQLTDEVLWTLGDFAFAGLLLSGTGLAFEAARTKTGDTAIAIAYRLGEPGSGPLELAALNGFWGALWLLSAGLFRRAGPAADRDRVAAAAGSEG